MRLLHHPRFRPFRPLPLRRLLTFKRTGPEDDDEGEDVDAPTNRVATGRTPRLALSMTSSEWSGRYSRASAGDGPSSAGVALESPGGSSSSTSIFCSSSSASRCHGGALMPCTKEVAGGVDPDDGEAP